MAHDYPLEMAGRSDPGLVREHNEDAIAWDVAAGIALLADGMGGHNAGDVASRLTLAEVMECLRSAAPGERPPAALLVAAVKQANARLREVAHCDPACAGMGTTFVGALFHAGRVAIAHVGDSRLYRLRDGELVCLTRDHSLLQQMIDQGAVSAEEGRHAEYRNIVTRALGHHDDVEVEVADLDVAPHDLYLLSSDGLHDMVEGAEVRALLADEVGGRQRTADALIARANGNGGRDNVSVILIGVSAGGGVHSTRKIDDGQAGTQV